MVQYRCYLLNRENRIARREDVEAEELVRAIERGHVLLGDAPNRFHGFEIWQGAERLHAFRRRA